MRKVLKLKRRSRFKVRLKRRIKIKKMMAKPEVKYSRISSDSINVVPNTNYTNQSLTNGTHCFGISGAAANTTGVLQSILNGTGNADRIGNAIFVKKIVAKFGIWICPTSADTASYDDMPFRLICHNAPQSTGGPVLSDFFATSNPDKTLDYVNMRAHTVHKDMKFVLRTHTTPITGIARSYRLPGYRQIIMSIPVNQIVHYTGPATTVATNFIRDLEKHTFNFSLFGFNHNLIFDSQIACSTRQLTIYFTDA